MNTTARWPAMFFKPDEDGEMQHQTFTGPDEVPDGWMDSPDKFDKDGKLKKGAKADIPGLEDIDGEGGDPDNEDGPEYPDYNEVTVDTIKDHLDAKELEYDSSANKPELYKLYVATFHVDTGDLDDDAIKAYLDAAGVEYEEDAEGDELYEVYDKSFESED